MKNKCRHMYWLRTTGRSGTPSKKLIRCCDERHGFMIKHWRCAGPTSQQCPAAHEQQTTHR
jgi:hypothetical protein